MAHAIVKQQTILSSRKAAKYVDACPKVEQRWHPTQKELDDAAKDCAKSLKKRIKTGDMGGWNKLA